MKGIPRSSTAIRLHGGSIMEMEYRIDSEDRIVSVNSAWEEFARRNHGAHLLPPAILGSRLWDSIREPTTRNIYRNLVSRIRKGSGPAEFLFRCDSPGVRRLLAMRVAPAVDGLVSFSVRTIAEEEREEVLLLDPTMRRKKDLVAICSWCLRLAVGDQEWIEIEDAVSRLGIFENPELPRLSHGGICPRCRSGVEGALAERGPRLEGEMIDLGISLPQRDPLPESTRETGL